MNVIKFKIKFLFLHNENINNIIKYKWINKRKEKKLGALKQLFKQKQQWLNGFSLKCNTNLLQIIIKTNIYVIYYIVIVLKQIWFFHYFF